VGKRARVAIFAGIVAVCVVGGGVSVAVEVHHAHRSAPPRGVRVVGGASLVSRAAPKRVTRATSVAVAHGPQLVFRNAIPDRTFGKVAVAPLAHPNAKRALSNLTCDRVYFAGGRGLCLTATSSFANSYVAKIFDASFHVTKTLKLAGIPSRARVSGDGRLGAMTIFVNGDSYAPGNFSTRTTIVELATGRALGNLEQFTVLRDGKRWHKRNFNFWGVTFAPDDDHFYATLGSGADTFLLAGSIRSRTLRVLHPHVECPSLSPDGTRVAYKRSLDSHGSWRLYVLDLHTMRETPLAETRSVDDQAEWRDNDHVLYWRGSDIWVVNADGSGTPAKLVTDASSPAVVRAD
jgi:hypothetical protein